MKFYIFIRFMANIHDKPSKIVQYFKLVVRKVPNLIFGGEEEQDVFGLCCLVSECIESLWHQLELFYGLVSSAPLGL